MMLALIMKNKTVKETFLFVLIIFLASCTETKELKSQANKENYSFIEHLSGIKLPEKLELFGEKIPLEIPEVRERAEREFYLNLQSPGQLILYIKRAGKYFPLFEKKLKEAGVPDDLKFLSVAESALYMSRSAKDAVGLWQFIPSTGKKMGLQIDDFVDERRQVEKSTEAAIKYLKNGYDAHKSWLLAAAGYNMGHENVKDNLDFQAMNSYFDLFLNEETSRYILRIAVIKEIMTNPLKYSINLPPDDIYRPEKVKVIKQTAGIPNLADWAKEFNTTYKEVKLLNPWILQRKLPPPVNKYYEISIPEN